MTTETTIEIEICTNREWIENHILDVEEVDQVLSEEAANEWSDAAFEQLLRIDGLNVKLPGGQRQRYHGWNGANTWKASGRGWGSFEDISGDLRAKIDGTLDGLTKEINDKYNVLAHLSPVIDQA